MRESLPTHPATLELPGQDQRIYQPTRRKFLAAAAGMFFGGYAANKIVTNALWPPNDPQLLLLPYSQRLLAAAGRQKEGWLTADGLGHQNGLPEATIFANGALHNKLAMAYFIYANNGITTESLAPLVAAYAKQFGYLSLYGDSLGGVTALDATRQASVASKQQIHLRRVVLNCSPFNLKDTWQAGIADLIARLDPQGGFAGEVAYNAYGALNHGPYDPQTFGAAIADSVNKTIYGPPPSLWTGQLALGANTDLNANWRDFKTYDIITPDTRALFCAPADLHRDGLVNNASAYSNWQDFFGRLGTTIDYLALPGAGHADTTLASRHSEPWIQATS